MGKPKDSGLKSEIQAERSIHPFHETDPRAEEGAQSRDSSSQLPLQWEYEIARFKVTWRSWHI